MNINHLRDEELENPELSEEEKESLKVQAVENFYDHDLEQVYAAVKVKKAISAPGERVASSDVSDYLEKKGETNLAKALKSGSTAALSYQRWNQFRKNQIDLFNDTETQAINDFLRDHMPLDSPLWDDLELAAARYQEANKENPDLQGKQKADYFIKQAKLKRLENKDAYDTFEDKIMSDFFQDHRLDEDFWSDSKKALAQMVEVHPQYANPEKAAYFLKIFNEKIEAYNKKETEDFEKFLKSSMTLTSPLWDDLDKAVAEFQKMDKRYQTKLTADWYKEKLAELKESQEKQYNELETATFNKFIEAAVQKNPQLLEDPKTLVAQFQRDHDQYSSSDKINHYLGAVDAWKKDHEKEFFARENASILDFLGQISPQELDNPKAALARYQNETEFKTKRNGEWFLTEMETHKTELRGTQNKIFASLAQQVGDPIIANAMIRSFEDTQSFEKRDLYLNSNGPDGIRNKVSEYAPLVAQIKEKEAKLKNISGASKELKAKLELAQGRYESGKTHYDTTFYSPKAYNEYLTTLLESSDQMVEQEAVVAISNKNFKDVPDLPKKETSYEEFRDQLKNKKFYNLHPLAYKNENVRSAVREKTNALYKQWSLARQDYLNTQKSQEEAEKNQSLEKARTSISRTRLSDIKALPTKEMEYEPFKNLVKNQNVYGLSAEQMSDPKVRRIMREKNQALLKDHNRLVNTNIRSAISDIKTKDIEHKIDPEKAKLGSYQEFRDYLKSQKVYDSIDPALMQNQSVRKAAQEQNKSLYAKLKQRFLNPESVDPLAESEVEATHQKTIEAIDNFGTNLDLKSRKIKDYVGFEKIFLLENPDIKSHFFDRAAYKTLLQTQWQDLQTEKESTEDQNLETENLETLETENEKDNELREKIPGHYKIKWDDLDKRLDNDKKSKGIDRFSKLLNRSESGLRTIMQHFHQPLGTFLIEALAVAPQEKIDRMFGALKEKPVTPGNREQASDWLKTFTETIGISFLQKETVAGFSALKQNYQTFFGNSLASDWDVEDQILDEEIPEGESPLDIDPEALKEDQNTTAKQQKSQNQDGEEIEELEAQKIDKNLEKILEDKEAKNLDLDQKVEILEVEEIKLAPIDEVFEKIPKTQAPTEILAHQPEAIEEDFVEVEENFTETELAEPEDSEEEVEIDENLDLEADSKIDAENSEIENETVELEPGVEMVFDHGENEEENLEEELPEPEELEKNFETEEENLEESVEEIAEETENELEDVEAKIIPIEVEIVLPEAEEKVLEKEEIIKDWKNFMQDYTAPKSAESLGSNLSSGPQELAPEMWQEVKVNEEVEALKLSEKDLEKVLLTPEGRQKLKINQQKFYKEKPEKSHFYPALYAEKHFISYLTIEKFLQQTKSYCETVFQIETKLVFKDDPQQEISAENAQELFKLIMNRLHQTENLKNITLGFEDGKIKVKTQKNEWNFPIKLEALA